MKNLPTKAAIWGLYILALRLMLECLYDIYFFFVDDPSLRISYAVFAVLMAGIAFALFALAFYLSTKISQ